MASSFSFKKYLTASFGNYGPKSEIEAMFTEDMYSTHVKMGAVVMLFEGIMIVLSILRGGPGVSARRQIYFFLYVALFSITALFMCVLIYLHNKKPEKIEWQINLSFSYAVCLCGWGSIVTLLDQRSGSNITVYSYILMATAVFCIIKPWQSLILFVCTFLTLNVCAIALNGNPIFFSEPLNAFNLMTNSLFTTALTIIIAITLYRYRVTKRHDRIVIQKQYDQISLINQKLNDLAMTDQLTGVGNRRFLEEKMQELLHSEADGSEQVIGMMLDIDFFKQYNDNFGHQAGDYCLKRLANVVKDFACKENAFVVRYGGEEFFVGLQGNEDALQKAQALLDAIAAENLSRNDVPLGYVTVSIGVDVEADWRLIGYDEFLRRCDEALYKAKNSGRNKVCSYS